MVSPGPKLQFLRFSYLNKDSSRYPSISHCLSIRALSNLCLLPSHHCSLVLSSTLHEKDSTEAAKQPGASLQYQ